MDASHRLASGAEICLVEGDITRCEVDAVVNAANAHLQHGGGVAAAIARRGGPVIQEASDAWVRKHGPISAERPAITPAGSLPCRFVIHAVGPVWGEGDEDRKLGRAVAGALYLASAHHLESLAMPAISTGIFGFPKDRAAAITVKAIGEFFETHPATSIRRLDLVLFDEPTFQSFLQAFRQRWPD
jgi:O-acetyl-ADP-ribose deacetylase (regulator of RNase III)